MDADASFDSVSGQCLSAWTGKQRVARAVCSLNEVVTDDGAGGGTDGCGPVLATFPVAFQVGAGAKVDADGGEAGDLADAKTGGDCEGQECLVTPANPCRGVGSAEESIGLCGIEVGKVGPGDFRWAQCEDLADVVGMFRMVRQRVGQDGADGGQALVAADGGVAALVSH